MQLLNAEATLPLAKLMRTEEMAADMLCIMAMQPQCKEPFLERPVMQLLTDCMTVCGTAFSGDSQQAYPTATPLCAWDSFVHMPLSC